jgi:hypothetical protein
MRDGCEQPKHAAQGVGCNKFVVFDSNKLLLICHGMNVSVYAVHEMTPAD